MAKKARNQRFEPELWSSTDNERSSQPSSGATHHQDVEGHRRIVDTLSGGLESRLPGLHGPDTRPAAGHEADGWPVHRTFFFVFAFNAAAWLAIIGAIYYVIS